MNKKNEKHFWITNFSNMNVSLTDLNLTVKSFSSIDLLDKKHYQYSIEQLLKSSTNGSIAKKKDKISVRLAAPEHKNQHITCNNEFIPSRERSILSIKEDKYDELNIDDVEYAKENADIANMDSQPLFIKVPHAK